VEQVRPRLELLSRDEEEIAAGCEEILDAWQAMDRHLTRH